MPAPRDWQPSSNPFLAAFQIAAWHVFLAADRVLGWLEEGCIWAEQACGDLADWLDRRER